ncbi:hypothetical protein ASPZODRAFT_67720 [Penicilliopsis zonata CBS 506.65]|uniref:Tyrosinase copper-binding domain-containing protein n=1 Tax=Penicilliopsis zonata CBS 506.65 TaxID=1073090 RepID=A0A1L9SFQ7_9EURO|nr:hypothetical protein ASPZODRAFT_67720 [Penicilliopsis zonata CBS 506.65]OJJ45991.1 hypothetical protein ASPZODRAFT_67720 [Penicilliopsis zonata CBS 506.65]
MKAALALGLALAGAVSAEFNYYNHSCTPETVRIRKEWRNLTSTEQDEYLTAVNCLMDLPAQSGLSATTNRFSDLQALHRYFTNTPFGDIIHDVGQFFPWHRYFIHLEETFLREECNYTGPLPWWNEEYDANTGEAFGSSMWDSDAFGGNGVGADNCVIDGAFANYTEHIGPENEDTTYCMDRDWNNDLAVASAVSNMVNICAEFDNYSQWYFCVAEINHKGVHTAVGGIMADIKSSPGDPVFFLHHAYIDRMWWNWQKTDPENRLYQIGGWVVNETANPEPAHGWGETTLGYVLSSYDMLPNVTVEEVMNPMNGYLCYDYEN